MFVKDLKNDFYNILLGNRVLLLVHLDVDAVCTCKILQDLFKSDNILYTLVPVGGFSELKTAYEENHEEIKYVVLVNCGATVDLVDILQPDEDVVFFVLDSHKPSNVCNVYSDGQVRLVWKDEEEDIPSFDDIFRDEDEEEDENADIRQDLEAIVTKKRERRVWEERRDKLMFEYTKFSYYGEPISCIALELSWLLSRCGSALVWAAAVAAAAADVTHARAPARLLLTAHTLQRRAASAPEVCQEKDLWLPLYRLWSLESAVTYSPFLAPRLKTHTRAGDARVRRLLADTGIPLQQARQAYPSMDVELRQNLLPSLEATISKYKLPPITKPCFLLKRTFAPTLSAHDMVYIIMGLLEHDKIPPAEGFSLSLSALSGCRRALGTGAARARAGLQAAAQSDTHGRTRGPVVHLTVPEGSAENAFIKGPLWLGVCGRWIAASLAPPRPLLVSLPKEEHTIMLGVPPSYDTDCHNLFGAAFEQAAATCGSTVSLDYVDSSVLSVPNTQRSQFLDALTHLLAEG